MTEIVSLMDAYRTSPDVIFPIPEYGVGGEYNYGEMTLSIHKTGGGSIGESHSGSWIVEIHHKGELIYSDASLSNHAPLTHIEAAALFADFTANGETAAEEFGQRLLEWAEEYTNVNFDNM